MGITDWNCEYCGIPGHRFGPLFFPFLSVCQRQYCVSCLQEKQQSIKMQLWIRFQVGLDKENDMLLMHGT